MENETRSRRVQRHQIVFRETPRGVFFRADRFFRLLSTDKLINLWVDGQPIVENGCGIETRDVPMETIDKGGWQKCPNCGSDVMQYGPDGTGATMPNYCPYCGQRVV